MDISRCLPLIWSKKSLLFVCKLWLKNNPPLLQLSYVVVTQSHKMCACGCVLPKMLIAQKLAHLCTMCEHHILEYIITVGNSAYWGLMEKEKKCISNKSLHLRRIIETPSSLIFQVGGMTCVICCIWTISHHRSKI